MGAFLLTFPAHQAERRVIWDTIKETSEEHRIELQGLFFVFIHVPTVVKLKTFRNIYTLRASKRGIFRILDHIIPDEVETPAIK